MQDILVTTRQRDSELAEFLEACCETPLRFDGDDPNLHSFYNHIHLFQLIASRQMHGWIDTAYMTDFAECIFARWRARLKGMAPYQSQGYRLYLYQDFAPTISVVAETPSGFPYAGSPTFVDRPAEIMALYKDFDLSEQLSPAALREYHILNAVERNKGSISKPTAKTLGLQVGELRKAIEWWSLQDAVNSIRKRYGRRPAQFRGDYDLPFIFKVYEERLQPRY